MEDFPSKAELRGRVDYRQIGAANTQKTLVWRLINSKTGVSIRFVGLPGNDSYPMSHFTRRVSICIPGYGKLYEAIVYFELSITLVDIDFMFETKFPSKYQSALLQILNKVKVAARDGLYAFSVDFYVDDFEEREIEWSETEEIEYHHIGPQGSFGKSCYAIGVATC